MKCVYCRQPIVLGQPKHKILGISNIHRECYGLVIEIIMELVESVREARDRRRKK